MRLDSKFQGSWRSSHAIRALGSSPDLDRNWEKYQYSALVIMNRVMRGIAGCLTAIARRFRGRSGARGTRPG